MKILVCISVVPDTTTKITFTENNTKFNEVGVQFIINPYDELALTKALEIAEANNGTVTAIHVGPANNDANLRKALAIGANDAVRIDKTAADAQDVAQEIAYYAKAENFDIILTGRESIDYNSGQVCGLIGALLNIPSINVVTKCEFNGNIASLERDIDGGREQITVKTPFVASAQKDLVVPRIPNMRGITAARTKPLIVLAATYDAILSIHQKYELPLPKASIKMIPAENAEELIRLLREEAKII